MRVRSCGRVKPFGRVKQLHACGAVHEFNAATQRSRCASRSSRLPPLLFRAPCMTALLRSVTFGSRFNSYCVAFKSQRQYRPNKKRWWRNPSALFNFRCSYLNSFERPKAIDLNRPKGLTRRFGAYLLHQCFFLGASWCSRLRRDAWAMRSFHVRPCEIIW